MPCFSISYHILVQHSRLYLGYIRSYSIFYHIRASYVDYIRSAGLTHLVVGAQLSLATEKKLTQTQTAQYPLIKEYTLNLIRVP